jgi:hypothetical protein
MDFSAQHQRSVTRRKNLSKLNLHITTVNCYTPPTVEDGSLNTLRLESLKLVFQPLHKFLVNLQIIVLASRLAFGKSVTSTLCMTQVIFPTIVYRCNNDLWWKKVRTKAQRGKCSYFYKITEHWTKQQTNRPVRWMKKNTKQEIITHKTQVGKGYLSIILNQRQRTTPASDWELYQAKHKTTTYKKDYRLPLQLRPWPN